MNASGIAALAIVLAAATSFVTVLAVAPEAQVTESSETELELARLRGELGTLQLELGELRKAAAAATVLRPAVDAGAKRLAITDIEAEVERLFMERWQQAVQEGLALPGVAAAAAGSQESSEDFLALLLDVGLDPAAGQSIWDRAREAGQLDELIAMFEARAEEHANDPEAQVDVGHAYLQKIFEVGDGPAAGLWAGKADASFDRALTLDDHHWEARSSKAISLSFWPPIFGKQKEAISHFEVLVAQQAAGAQEDRHAQTYLLLGNLYHQTGQGDKGNAIWQQGLSLFPNDASLSEQLGGNSGQ